MLVVDPGHVERDAAPRAAHGACAAVATAFPLATAAGLEILRAGGNAMDAAVAAAWALSVCEPSASGLGGQTVLLVRFADGRTRIIDGQSCAPIAASLDTITASQQRRGYRACTVPSTPSTLDWAQRRYGVLGRARVMAPAIRIAEEGYPITRLQHRQTRWVSGYLRGSPSGELFLREGRPLDVGSTFRQPALAATLRRLADLGADDFYRGEMARQIATDMQARGGLITSEDLAACAPPVEVHPLSMDCGGYRYISAPPPSGGLQILLARNVMAAMSPPRSSFAEDVWREAVALTISAVFREREHRPVAPDGLTPALIASLLSRNYARQVARDLLRPASHESADAGPEEPGDTTHVSICDADGMIVLLTQSIQSLFGAKVAHRELGFLYNNYLCTCPRGSHPYGLRPRCRPRSNIAPTLVLRRGREGDCPLLALGAAGSRRITSAILQVMSGVIDRGLDVRDAVAAPRVHGLVGRKIWIERPAASDGLLARLRARDREPIVKSPLNYAMGAVQALEFMTDGSVRGAADPRRDGAAGVL